MDDTTTPSHSPGDGGGDADLETRIHRLEQVDPADAPEVAEQLVSELSEVLDALASAVEPGGGASTPTTEGAG